MKTKINWDKVWKDLEVWFIKTNDPGRIAHEKKIQELVEKQLDKIK